MTYPGGKSQAGVYQWLINHMPPHSTYVEAFLGSGAVLRMKKAAPVANIGVEIDEHVVNAFNGDGACAGVTVICCDAISWLEDHKWMREDTLIYLDPPYLMETRHSQRKLYNFEMTDEDHRRLLRCVRSLKCMVMISGYDSEMYAAELADWRMDCLDVRTRGGRWAVECLWMNYPPPFELHDYRYLGVNFRERERIKRKKQRWVARLSGMTMLERACLLEAVNELRSGVIGGAGDDAGRLTTESTEALEV